MKNQYLFFAQQNFENFDLLDYKKTEISIPKTSVYIYEFECVETDSCKDEAKKAMNLDKLTQRLNHTYPDAFQIITSESSQFFCRELYTYVVGFETKLRYVLYIARALFENTNGTKSLSKGSFLYKVDKKDQTIEEIDFGKIYEYIFADQNIQSKINDLNCRKMTKADWKKKIESLDENTVWQNIVGTSYGFIEKHFLDIIQYRNDVMHNHIISFEDYKKATDTLQKAIQELEQAINDILLTNKSHYLNNVNIIDAISIFLKAIGIASKTLKESPIVKAFQLYAKSLEGGGDTSPDVALIESAIDSDCEENNDSK